MSAWQRWALATVSGVFLTMLYPPFDCAWLAWVALTPLLVAVDGTTWRSGLFLGWLSGSIGALGVTGYWIFRAARDYFQFSLLGAGAFVFGTTQAFVGVYFGLFGLAVALLPPRRWRWVLIPALFVATEYARAHLLSGNPWALLGHSQHSPRLIQWCDLTGVYGLSFLLALAAAAVADLRRTRTPVVAALTAVVLVLVYGAWRLRTVATTEVLPIVMVQADLPNEQRGRPEFFAPHLQRYLDLTRTLQSAAPALTVWPENAVGFFPQENPVLTARITDVLHQPHAALLTGAPRAGGRPGVAVIYNSAYLFSADGVAAVYDKRMLLPFVERFPLRPEDGPYLPGGEPTLFALGGTRLGVLICYEAIYPELARDLVQRGARLLVNISNDSWFEAGAGPEQHYDLARFRAVEYRVSLVRVTNSGISGVIDPLGREIARLPARTPAAASVAVPLGPGRSFYARYGDVFAVACILVSMAVALGRVLGLLPH